MSIPNFNSGSRKVYVESWGNVASFPQPAGNLDTIYIDISANTLYRWTGSTYQEIGQYASVDYYADLPAMPDASYADKIYRVRYATGVRFLPGYKASGYYTSDGINWSLDPILAGALGQSDIVDNLLSTDATKVLSAKQGKTLKDLIDSLTTGVSSVFGRTGSVSAQSGDYTAVQITNTPAGNISSITAQAAINELDSEKEPNIAAGTVSQFWRGDKSFQTLNAAALTDFNSAADARISAAIGVSVQAQDATLQALANLANGADKLAYFTGTDTMATIDFSSNARTFIQAIGTPTPTSGNLLIGSGTQWLSNSMSGDATINNTGVIAIGAGKITNAMLAGSIANAKLANSTISGIALGSNLNNLTISAPLSGSSYNGSSAISIGLASGYGDSQNPYASKTANYFLAAPNGVAGVPTFRAIVAADIPTLNQNTTGSAAKLTTARTIWGQSFDGSANVTGNITATAANLTNATNQLVLGTTLTQTISAVAPSVSRVGTIRDFGANFVFPQATAGFNCFFTTTNNTTAIFPTSGSQTLVNTTTPQTISNKTLTLASAKGLQFAWLNDTDITKTASIVVNDSQTASTQTSHVLPSVSGTLINDAVTTLSSLASVGTITTGTWSATTIAVNKGGSGRTSATAYGVICGGATSTAAHQSVAVGSSGQFLASAGAGALPAMRNLAASDLPAGIVRLANYVIKTDVFSTNSTSYTDWTGITLTVAQTSGRANNSKFKISLRSGVANDTDNSFQYVGLFRSINGGAFTQIAQGDTIPNSGQRCWIDAALGGSGNYTTTLKNISGEFIDAPATSSSIVYKCQVIRTYAGIAYFGRTANTVDQNRSSIPTVFIIEEILQ